MIVSYLEGKSKKNLSPLDCKIVGRESARLHDITKNFHFKRGNDLSIKSWRKIFDQVKDKCNKIHPDLPKLIEGNLLDVEKYWPNNLPTGIIHADLFSDNNALCFDGVKENLSFNVTKAKKFIEGYNEVRKISDEERKSIKVLSQGAALRFLLTRVFDYINIVDGAVVKIKDPIEYLKRLEFHKNAKSFEDYLI